MGRIIVAIEPVKYIRNDTGRFSTIGGKNPHQRVDRVRKELKRQGRHFEEIHYEKAVWNYPGSASVGHARIINKDKVHPKYTDYTMIEFKWE